MANYTRYGMLFGEIINRQDYKNRQKFINSILITIAVNPNFLGAISVNGVFMSNDELTKHFGSLKKATKKDLNQLCIDILKGKE